MSQREKVIAGLIGVAIAALITVVLVKFFLTHHAQIKKELGASEMEIKRLRGLELERAMWSQRDTWLNANMPVLEDSSVANKQLTDAIQEKAKTHQILIESPILGIPNKQPNYTSLTIRVSARGAWKGLAQFIRELQIPGEFIVLENVDLKVDPNDKTQMKAEMAIAKWFAPQQR